MKLWNSDPIKIEITTVTSLTSMLRLYSRSGINSIFCVCLGNVMMWTQVLTVNTTKVQERSYRNGSACSLSETVPLLAFSGWLDPTKWCLGRSECRAPNGLRPKYSRLPLVFLMFLLNFNEFDGSSLLLWSYESRYNYVLILLVCFMILIWYILLMFKWFSYILNLRMREMSMKLKLVIYLCTLFSQLLCRKYKKNNTGLLINYGCLKCISVVISHGE